MFKSKISQIRKRDGSVVPFDASKIENALFKALTATKTGDHKLAADLTAQVVKLIEKRITQATPTVEQVQDIVEEVLMSAGYGNVARAYILYRQQRAEIQELRRSLQSLDKPEPTGSTAPAGPIREKGTSHRRGRQTVPRQGEDFSGNN